MRILVIEDERYIRENIVDILRFNDYEVVDAANGAAGLQVARQTKPDLIVCDIMMDGVDGYSVLRTVRDDPEMTMTPFIFLTALADHKSLRQGMAAGADDYIIKPFTPDELIEAINVRMARQHTVVEETSRRNEAARREMVNTIVQEINGPLTSVNAVLDIVAERRDYLTSGELQEMLDTASYGSRRISHLLDQMAFLIQLESGRLSYESVQMHGKVMNLYDLITTAINPARTFALYTSSQDKDVDIQITPPDELLVLCQTNALRYAIAEVISNAIAYSPNAGTIRIQHWQDNQTAWLSVEDQGCGIDADWLHQFIEYRRGLDTVNETTKGMGLSLVYGIVLAHGGELQINSEPDKGTQVCIAIPLIAD